MIHHQRTLGVFVLVLGGLVTFMSAAPAWAEPVVIAAVAVEFGIPQLEFPTHIRFYTQYETQTPTGLKPRPRVLDTVFIPDGLPQTVRATAASDVDFGPFVDLLTNDRPDKIEFTYETPSKQFGESFAFGPLDTNAFSVDWDAFVVTAFSYTLFEYSFDTSRSQEVPGIGVLHPVELRGLFQVEGSPVQGSPVPEPSSILLSGLGLACVVRRKWAARTSIKAGDR
jgi:hypothetical protein